MYYIGADDVEQSIVVGNDDRTGAGRLQFVNAFNYDSQGINIQTRVRFVENRQFWLKHSHLKNFVTLFFATASLRLPNVETTLYQAPLSVASPSSA